MARKINARDIAACAGVSLSTVDRVINKRGGVHLEKERRVLEALSTLQAERPSEARYNAQLRVAVLIQPTSDPMHSRLRDGFTDANVHQKDLCIGYYVHAIGWDDTPAIIRFLRQVADDYDGLIASLPDEPQIRRVLAKLSAKLPVILMVTEIEGSGRLLYVGIDNFRAGRVAGELMGRFLPKVPASVLCLTGSDKATAHVDRRRGFQQVMKTAFPHLHVVSSHETTRDDVARAAAIVSDMMDRYPDIKGIYNASAGAKAIASVLQKNGLPKETVFITHELTDDRIALLKEGMIDAVIDQNPLEQVRVSTDAMAIYFRRMPGLIPPDSTRLSIFTAQMVL